jgi:UDP-glucose 4-epimerase
MLVGSSARAPETLGWKPRLDSLEAIIETALAVARAGRIPCV